MPRFAANLSMLFAELPFMERFAAARAAGFEAVEYLFPYEFEASELRRALDDAGLKQVLFNAPPGDWAAGERGLAALPGHEVLFHRSIEQALDYAGVLGVGQIHVMAGIADANDRTARAAYLENLRRAAGQAAKRGVRLLIEPLNPHDVPGYFLSSVEQAAAIIEETGSNNLFIQYDLYHQSRAGGELIGTYQRHRALIGHMQVAGNPGRHEPDSGEIDYRFVFHELDRLGYDGWIGAEYAPKNGTVEGLGWFKPWRAEPPRSSR